MPYHGKILLGLTGNIGCGKSTVLRRLHDLGAYTIDADRKIHEILRKGGPAYWPVVSEFGPGILSEDGEIDRRALGQVVFSDPEKLRLLEEIEHPIVRRAIDDEIGEADKPVVVLDAIKLIESGWADKCDAVWAVTCTRDDQIKRLMSTRGYPREEAEMRIDAQAPQEQKVARADVVLVNSGTLEDLDLAVKEAWRQFTREQGEMSDGIPQPSVHLSPPDARPWRLWPSWLRFIWRVITERTVWLALLVGLLAVVLAYQIPRSLFVDVGGTFDDLHAVGFYEPQSVNCDGTTTSASQSGDSRSAGTSDDLESAQTEQCVRANYRWSAASGAFLFQGIGKPSAPFPVTLQLSSGRAPGSPPITVPISINGHALAPLALTPESAPYVLTVDPDWINASGDVRIDFTTPTFRASADKRDLGFLADFARVDLPLGLTLPSFTQLVWLMSAGLLLYIFLRSVWLTRRAAGLVTLAFLLACAGLVAVGRLLLTVFTPCLAFTLLLALLVVILIEPLLRWLTRAAGWRGAGAVPEWAWAGLRALVALSLILKVGGLLYPHSFIIDAPFHLKYIIYMHEGRPFEEFFGKSLALSVMPSDEWGSARAFIPYSPFFYVIAAPLANLPMPLELSMPAASGTFEALKVALVFLVALALGTVRRRNDPQGSARVAVASAAVYAAIPATFLLQQFGNWPTQTSLWLLTLWAAVTCLFWPRLTRPWIWIISTLLLTLTLLAYTVTAVYAGILLGVMFVAGWLFAPGERKRWSALAFSAATAAVLAVLIYYGRYFGDIIGSTLPTFAEAAQEQGKLTTLRPSFYDFIAGHMARAMQSYKLDIIYALGLAGALWIFFRRARPAGRRVPTVQQRRVYALTSRLPGGSAAPANASWQQVWIGAWLLLFPLFSLADFYVDQALKQFWIALPVVSLAAATWLLAVRARAFRSRSLTLLLWLLPAVLVWQSLSLWVFRLLFHNR